MKRGDERTKKRAISAEMKQASVASSFIEAETTSCQVPVGVGVSWMPGVLREGSEGYGSGSYAQRCVKQTNGVRNLSELSLTAVPVSWIRCYETRKMSSCEKGRLSSSLMIRIPSQGTHRHS